MRLDTIIYIRPLSFRCIGFLLYLQPMRKHILALLFLIWVWKVSGQCPQITAMTYSASPRETYCPGKSLPFSIFGTRWSVNSSVEIYGSGSPSFNPLRGEGVSLGRKNLNELTCNPSACPLVNTIYVDGCGSEDNEMVIMSSGGGLNYTDIVIDFDSDNNPNFCAGCGDIGVDCNLTPLNSLPGCTTLKIAAGDGYVPPNALVVIFTSSSANSIQSFSTICGFPVDVYAFKSTCNRGGVGAFTNKGEAIGTRNTIVRTCVSCAQDIVYNTEDNRFSGVDGDVLNVSATNEVTPGTFPCTQAIGSPVPLPFTLETTLPASLCGVTTIYFKAVIRDQGCETVYDVPVPFTNFTCPAVTIQALPDSSICRGASTNLFVSPAQWNRYQWSTNRNGSTIPVMPGSNTIYTVTVTDGQGCTTTDQLEVKVTNPPIARITAFPNDSVCAGETVTLMATTGPGFAYKWSDGSTRSTLSTTLTATKRYDVTITNNSCPGKDSIFLTTLSPEECFSSGCPEVVIQPFGKTICNSGGIQTLVAILGTGPTGGTFTWSGPGITQPTGLFDPQAAGIGAHALTVTYRLDTCTWDLTDTVMVINPAATVISAAEYCRSANETTLPVQLSFNGIGPFTIYYTLDGQPSRDTVIDERQVTLLIPLNGRPAFFRLDSIYDGSCQGMVVGNDEITIIHPLTYRKVEVRCVGDFTRFTVTLELDGDRFNRYALNVPGTWNGKRFTSAPLPVATAAVLELQSRCDTISASVPPPQCVCAADAGTLRITFDTFLYCSGSLPGTINLTVETPAQAGFGQQHWYILHDGKADSIGTVIFTSPTAQINTNNQDLLPALYVAQSAVVSLDENNQPDWSLPCLDLSNPQYVRVALPPTATLTDSVVIVCGDQDSVAVPVNITGRPPVTLSFLQNSIPLQITAPASGNTSILLSAAIPTLLQLTAIEDAVCSNQARGSLEILLVENDTGYMNIGLCPGDTMTWRPKGYRGPAKSFHAGHRQDTFWLKTLDGCDSLVEATVKDLTPGIRLFERNFCRGGFPIPLEGRFYDDKNTTDTIVSRFKAANGCDSFIYVKINVLEPVRDTIRPRLCLEDTVRYGGVLFGFDYEVEGELRFSGAAANGCDSFLYVAVEFLEDGQGFINVEICPRDTIVVGPEKFGAFRKSGVVILPNGGVNGCDSIVVVNLRDRRLPIGPTQTFIICPKDTIRPFNIVYHAERRIGVDTLFGAAADGCDSLVPVQIQLKIEPEFILDPILCPGESVIVNGTTYNATNPTGLEILSRAATNQCDSIVSIQLSFYEEVVDTLVIPLCIGADITIGGVTFDRSNPEGQVVAGQKVTGCDSLVYVIIQDASLLEGKLDVKLCPGASFELEGEVFNAARPSGDVLLVAGSVDGCDSLVHVAVTFYDTIRFLLQETLCVGDTVLVNGIPYYAGQTQGVETLAGAGANGCDSMVVVNLTFLEAEVTDLELHLCPGESTEIGDQVFDSTHLSGTVILPGQSEFGCDLIFNVTAVIDRITFGVFNPILCPGQSVLVNGVRYDESRPQGLELLLNKNQFGCDSIVTIDLQFRPINVQSTSLVSGCNGQITKSVTITSTDFGLPPYRVDIPGKPVVTIGQLPYTFLVADSAKTVTYELTDANGCKAQETVIFDTIASNSITLGPDQVIKLGESTTIEAISNFPIASYTLLGADNTSCTNCLPLTIQPLRTIQYRLKALDASGCTSEDDITITVEQLYRLYIPNIFSPNGDNVNDYFVLGGDENLTMIHKLQIFDPWGELVFEAREYFPDAAQPAWDGRFHGELMKPGVFVYLVEASFIDGARRTWSGDLTLMR